MVKSVTIIGLGLIGGSAARALSKKAGLKDIRGIDQNPEFVKAALDEGVISEGGTSCDKRLCDADVLLLCTPVTAIPAVLSQVAPLARKEAVIADLASVNGAAIEAAEKYLPPLRYISAHPMAGSEKGGYFASKAHLFENAYVILSPGRGADGDAVNEISGLFKAMGALTVTLGANEHDRAAALISHLPHVAAAALVGLLEKEDTPERHARRFAAGGFKDITRIASSDPAMWTDIAFLNKRFLADTTEKYIALLKGFLESLEDEDRERVYKYFAGAKAYRDSIEGDRGMLPSVWRLSVDVEDRAGAALAALKALSDFDISIKNIAIENSRDYEGGIMTLEFASKEDMLLAKALLKKD